MRKVIGFAVAWALYWMGDLVSRQMGEGRGYGLYSKLMIASGDVQDWAGTKGPWVKVCMHYPVCPEEDDRCDAGLKIDPGKPCSENEKTCAYAQGRIG